MSFLTRAAHLDDVAAILELLPRLADYPLPTNRTSEMFWSDDADLVRRWSTGDAPETFVRVGVDVEDSLVAVGIVSLREDMFSKDLAAHLEVVVVAEVADGSGLGRRLIAELEIESRERGAVLMTLHVLGNNERARYVYGSLGYDEEMIRAVKFL